MDDFALLLRSYSGDLAYAERLVSSYEAHNPSGLTLYCVVSSAELPAFSHLASDTVNVLTDDSLARHFTSEPLHGIRPGYINQEIVKLAFWETGLAANYFCVDSDAVFIRDITIADFMSASGVPYTVLVEDNDLKSEPGYYAEHWLSREAHLRRIAAEVELQDPILRTCHGHQVFSATVLESFTRGFLEPRGWSYLDALRIAPYEFTWYNFWLQKSEVIPIHQREPLVKVYHNEAQYLDHVLRGISLDDLARGYLAVVVNSNFSRSTGLTSLQSSKPVSLAEHLSYGETGALVAAKVRSSLRRAFGADRSA